MSLFAYDAGWVRRRARGLVILAMLSLTVIASLLAWYLSNWQAVNATNRNGGWRAESDSWRQIGTAVTTTQERYAQGGRIHVAAIQLGDVEGGMAANLANIHSLVREAAARGARYILLPEYFPGQLVNQAGMTVEEVLAGGQDLDGPISRSMLDLCKELGVYLAFPLFERRTDGRVYNSMVFAGPGGVEGVYSKTTLISPRRAGSLTNSFTPGHWEEPELFAPGTTNGVLTWGGVRVGALICVDGIVPQNYWTRSNRGVQMFCHSSASSGTNSGEDNPNPDVAARRYKRPVLFANHWYSGTFAYGNTQICDAHGAVLSHVGAQPNVVIDAVIDLPPIPKPLFRNRVSRVAPPTRRTKEDDTSPSFY